MGGAPVQARQPQHLPGRRSSTGNSAGRCARARPLRTERLRGRSSARSTLRKRALWPPQRQNRARSLIRTRTSSIASRSPPATSAASTAPRARTGTRVAGARLPRVPRRLRHRDEPPRLQDPLQDPERRPAHARRARLRAVDRHGARAPRAQAAARVARERAPAARLRRRRLLAPVRAHVHERPHDARPRRHPAARAPIAARTIRSSSPAARRRRTPSRSRRSSTPSCIGDGEERTTEVALALDRAQGEGRAAPRAPRRARQARAASTCPSLYEVGRRRRHGHRGRRSRARAGPAASREAQPRRRPQQVPVPRRRPGRRPRGHLRSHVDRDRARLHRGLPLLPGGHDLPARARARSRADRRDRRRAP